MLRLILALLPACAAAAPTATTLAKVRSWPVYDARTSAALDFADLCRLARLPCGAIVAPGESLAAAEGPVAGQTVGALLDRLLAAHPGYEAEMRDGVLSVSRKGGACASALSRPTPAIRYPIRSARVAALMVLRGSGWPEQANARLVSLNGDREDARYQDVDVFVHKGATVRDALDAIARGDGRMLWVAETGPKTCSGFRLTNWREPQAVQGASVMVSVSGKRP